MAAAPTTTAAKVVTAVIIDSGRVLQYMGKGDDFLVKRGEPVPLDFEDPILVCTRNDDLEAVLETTPKSRWKVAKLGEPLIDGKTDTNTEGLTASYGKWASAIATVSLAR